MCELYFRVLCKSVPGHINLYRNYLVTSWPENEACITYCMYHFVQERLEPYHRIETHHVMKETRSFEYLHHVALQTLTWT